MISLAYITVHAISIRVLGRDVPNDSCSTTSLQYEVLLSVEIDSAYVSQARAESLCEFSDDLTQDHKGRGEHLDC